MFPATVEVILNEEDQPVTVQRQKLCLIRVLGGFAPPPNIKYLLSFTHHVAAGDEDRCRCSEVLGRLSDRQSLCVYTQMCLMVIKGGGALEGGVTTFYAFKHLNKLSTCCEEHQFLDQNYY